MNQKSKSLNSSVKWRRHALAQACLILAAGVSMSALALEVPTGPTTPPNEPSNSTNPPNNSTPSTNYTPGAAFASSNAALNPLTQSTGEFWSTGYNLQSRNYQYGSGQVNGTLGTSEYLSSLSGPGSTPVVISNNNILVNSFGNQGPSSGLALNSLVRVSNTNDGQLALNLQIFSAAALAADSTANPPTEAGFAPKAVLATVTDTRAAILQSGKSSAALTLSGNTLGTNLEINTADTTLSGATPAAYASSTQGASSVNYGDNNKAGTVNPNATQELSVRGTQASVNLSNLQTTFNAYGTSDVMRANVTVAVSGTETVGVGSAATAVLSDSININGNTVKASNTNNQAVNIVESTAGSSAFTGSTSVTNIQATKITSDVTATQLANVGESNVKADLRNAGQGETQLTGSLNLNGNTVTAKAMGNTAGARNASGGISAGNAIVFDGNSDITGSTAPMALGASGATHNSSISTGTTEGKADLLINSVQRNAGNTFMASIDTSAISSNVDMLKGGSINQNGNTQATSASGNVAGNLIIAGPSASIGSIVANAAILNTQENRTASVTGSVKNATQNVTVGIGQSDNTITGAVNLNDNTIAATAEGNVAASTLSLKASTLRVGGNGGNAVVLAPLAADSAIATSGLSSSVLSSQKNSGLKLLSTVEASSITANFDIQTIDPTKLPIDNTQVSVNGNSMSSSATANASSNGVVLSATNATGLNAGLGNAQSISGESTVNANAGFGMQAELSAGIRAANVTGSALSLNNNTSAATAKGNFANNNMTVTVTNASGLGVVSNGMFMDSKPMSQASYNNDAPGVTASADFALANAQASTGTTLGAVLQANNTIAVSNVDESSTLAANQNSLTASGSINNASNAVNLNAGNLTGMTAGVSSVQSAINSVATAQTTARVLLDADEIKGASSLTLNRNTLSATVSANTVINSLNLTATNASGRDINVLQGTNTSSAQISTGLARASADFALSNNQVIATTSSNFEATTNALTKADVGNVDGASSVTVSGNNTMASVSGNSATNAITLAVTNLTQPNTGLSSVQSMGAASFKASVLDIPSMGAGTAVDMGIASNAQIAVTSNAVKAVTMGNMASNSIALSGSNVTGSGSNFDAPRVMTSALNNEASSPSSMALVSVQTSTGNNMSATVGTDLSPSQTALTATAVNSGSKLSVTDNSLSSTVYNNSVNNSVALNVTNVNSMTVGLASAQKVDAVMVDDKYTALTATTAGKVSLTATEVKEASAVTLSTNELKSSVVGNSAGNTLSVTATNASGRNSRSDVAAEASLTKSGADFALVSEQLINQASVLTATTLGAVSLTANAVNASALSANDNTVSAYVSANNVSNQLNLATTNLTAASAGLANNQISQSNAQVLASNLSSVSVTMDAVTGSAISQTGNAIKATSLGNVANNQLSLTGSNATVGAMEGAGSQAGNYSNVSSVLALANKQEIYQGQVKSSVGSETTAAKIEMDADAVTSASTLTLSGNSLSSLNYANNATNAMTLGVTNMTGMSAGVANGQYAKKNASSLNVSETFGSVLADVDNISTGSALTVAGNAITASSNVNYAGNSLQVSAAQIAGRNVMPSLTANPDTLSLNPDPIVQATSDLSVTNRQDVKGLNASTNASVVGKVLVTALDVTASNVNLNSNVVSGYASGNSADNGLLVGSTGLNGASLALGSVQVLQSANVESNNDATVKLTAVKLDNAKAAVNDNLVKSTAVGNMANNTLTATVSNASGATDSRINGGASTLSTATTGISSVTSDLALNNNQMAVANGDATRLKAQIGTDNASASIAQTLDQVKEGAVASVNGNTLNASAYSNSAVNAMSVGATDMNRLTTGIGSIQVNSNVDVSATTMANVTLDAKSVADSKLTLNNNLVTAGALLNTVTNSLDITASTATGRNTNGFVNLSDGLISADYAVNNSQVIKDLTGNATVKNDLRVSTAGENLSNSTVNMDGNSVLAFAKGNQASNALSASITTLNAVTSGVLSQQVLENSGLTANITGSALTTTGNVVNSAATVNNNQTKATTLGNLANNQLSLSGSSAQSNSFNEGITASANGNVTTADVGLSNQQKALNATLGATIGSTDSMSTVPDQDAYKTQLIAGNVSAGSTLTVNSNVISSLGYVNSASNVLDVGVSKLSAMNTALNSLQSVQQSSNSVTTKGDVQLSVTSVDTANAAVNSNLVAASAYNNSVSNSAVIEGTNVSGRGIAREFGTSVGSGGNTLNNAYALNNVQTSENGSISGTTTSNVTLTVGGMIPNGLVDSANLALNSNAISAYASGNSASSQLELVATTLTKATLGLGSAQTGSDFGVTATTTGNVSLRSGEVKDSSLLSAQDNSIKATALGNVASNTVKASATSVTSTETTIAKSDLVDGMLRASADVSLVSSQSQNGNVTATTTGNVAIQTEKVSDSTLSLTGNTIQSLAQANSVSNALTLDAAQQNDVTASVLSYQGNTQKDSVTATTSPTGKAVGITSLGDMSNVQVVVSGNTVSALAGKNEAFNTLTVSGANLLSRQDSVTNATVGAPIIAGADFVVMNQQNSVSDVKASVDAAASGFETNSKFTGGSVSVSDNTVLASANANTSVNNLNLVATNRLEGSGVVTNVQTMAAGSMIEASVLATSALSVETGSAAGNATVAVTGNQVKASASGNTASNALNAIATNAITGAGAGTSPVANNTTPTFAVLNSQSTGFGSSVDANIKGFSMGGVQLNGALNAGGSANVTGNSIQAVAYGNSASNTLQLSALPAGLNTASGSITNVQYNLASVTSTVSGAKIQGNAATNVSGGSGVNISGNSVVAMAVGNRAVNTVVGR